VTSGLIMLMVQSAVAGLVARDPDASPREAVSIVNRVLFENIRHRLLKDDFVTFSLLRVSHRKIVFAGCHEEFIVMRGRDKKIDLVSTPGTWLGVLPDIEQFTKDTVLDLEPDDLVVLYTDGITEARNDRGEQYGLNRLSAALDTVRAEPIEQIRDHVLADVARWTSQRRDDATLVLIRQMN
jgi:sigma-B regulation protein RsbU (phosphoserine phosphatase)